MSQLAQIRTALVARMSTVPGVGVVHDRERYAREEAKFRQLYVHGERLCGWWVRRSATQRKSQTIQSINRIDTWTLRGYLALADEQESELAFDAVIDSLCHALNADLTLGGVCDPAGGHGDEDFGVQVIESGPVTFCNVLCHSARLELRTSVIELLY